MDAWTNSGHPIGATVFGYTRVTGTDRHEALAYLNKAEEWIVAKMAGMERVSGGFFRDAHDQGGKPIRTRPAGARLMAMCQRGDMIVSRRLADIFSSVDEFIAEVPVLSRAGISLTIGDIEVGPKDDCVPLLEALKEFGAFMEGYRDDAPPGYDVLAVCEAVEKYRFAGKSWIQVVRSLNKAKSRTRTGKMWTIGALEGWVSRMRKQGKVFP